LSDRAPSVWMAAAEARPLAQTGGLADVLRGLPPAVAALGLPVRRFLPAYGDVDRTGFAHEDLNLAVPLGPGRVPARFLSRTEPGGVRTTLVENDELFSREGLYGAPGGAHRDNARRFIFFSRAVLAYAARAAAPPAILHVHDWHTAIVPLFARLSAAPRRPRTVLTIHNLGYQGRFGPEEIDWMTLSEETIAEVFRPEILEDHGGVNLLKAGLALADRLIAVSPTYAREILTREGGFGLDAVLRRRERDLLGILNGADYDLWNPAGDRHLPRPYGPDSLDGKDEARGALRAALGLPAATRPICGVVSRFVQQKGIDLVLRASGALLEAGADLALLGVGEVDLTRELERLHAARPDRVGLFVGFDERLSHLVVAGSDLLLVPSRYEPCGLVQMHALRYGTIPVVRRTGGLADTIRDETAAPGRGTGFVFGDLDPEELATAVRRALGLRAADPSAWRDLQRRAMAEDFSWDRAARGYVSVYRDLLV
jgi:starch synthase